MTTETFWTDERTEILRGLWKRGLSCSEIARALGAGCTRNAVIGKVHRMKLPGRKPGAPRSPRPPRTRIPKATRKAMKVKPERKVTIAPPKLLAPVKPVAFTAEAWQPLPGSRPVTLEHATGCRWCVSDPFGPPGIPSLFCNEPVVEGMSWCREHKARAFGGGTPSEKAAVRFARRQVQREYGMAA